MQLFRYTPWESPIFYKLPQGEVGSFSTLSKSKCHSFKTAQSLPVGANTSNFAMVYICPGAYGRKKTVVAAQENNFPVTLTTRIFPIGEKNKLPPGHAEK